MRIFFNTPSYSYNSVNNHKQQRLLSVPVKDSVSFTAMKKNQFNEVEFAVVEKFKAPIEKFKTADDLQVWAGNECDKILTTNYKGKFERTQYSRYKYLKDWAYYLKEEEKFSNIEKLIILNGVVKDMKPNDTTMPPVYNHTVLNATMSDLIEKIKENKKYPFDFGGTYKKNLREFYIQRSECPKKGEKWIVIPSRKNDPENYNDNVRKLKSLSYKTWCTKGEHADILLKLGDFHIYVKDGEPKIGISFDGEGINDMQDIHNNNFIGYEYFDILDKHITEGKYYFLDRAVTQYKTSKTHYEFKKKALEKIGEAIEKKDNEKIFNYFGIKTRIDEKGNFIISHYGTPKDGTFEELGIDEQSLFNSVDIIEGNADLSKSKLKSLGKLKYVGGDFDLSNIEMDNLGELEEVGGNAKFTYSKTGSFNKLKRVGGNLNVEYAEIGYLGNLNEVAGEVIGADKSNSPKAFRFLMKNNQV